MRLVRLLAVATTTFSLLCFTSACGGEPDEGVSVGSLSADNVDGANGGTIGDAKSEHDSQTSSSSGGGSSGGGSSNGGASDAGSSSSSSGGASSSGGGSSSSSSGGGSSSGTDAGASSGGGSSSGGSSGGSSTSSSSSSGGSSGGSSSSSSSSSGGSSGGSSSSSSSSSGGSSGGTSSSSSSSSGGSSGGSSSSSSSSSGGGSSSSSSSGGGASSGGTNTWPAGPEDKITGVPASKAKYTSCGKAWTCAVTACQFSLDAGCMDVCLKASSTQVVGEIMNLRKCFTYVCHGQQCPKGDKKCLSDCLWSRCSGFGMACNAAGKTGTKTCNTALGCYQSCKGAGTIGCLTSCYTTLSKSAQQDFVDLWFCIAKSTASEPYAACAKPTLTCTSGGATGAGSCLDISLCESACKDKAGGGEHAACTAACYGKGSATAQSQYAALMSCVVKAKDAKLDPGPACGKAVATCAGAKPDGTKGALGCQDVWGCEDACKKAGKLGDGCTMSCLSKTSVSEAVKWWQLAMCWGGCDQSCAGKTGKQREKCVEACTTKQCKAPMNACLGL